MIKVKIKKAKDLTKKEIDLMVKQRIKEYGKNTIDFRKEKPSSVLFFVEKEKEIVAFGMLIPVAIKYLNKTYNIKGICNIISLKKKKGYGKMIIQSMIDYLKKTGKTGLGFCDRESTKFYSKSGLETKKNFILKFKYKDRKTGKIVVDNDGDGIYYKGKDKFISKILSTKSIVYIEIPFW